MLNGRQFWLLAHIGLGSAFLHGVFVGSRALLDRREGPDLERTRARAALVMASAAWLTVVTGTWGVYAWYRAKPVPHATKLAYPQAWLAAHPGLAGWHDFGMEWKEHIGWLAPILATTAAVAAVRHRAVLASDWRPRRLVVALFSLAFAAALVAAVVGAAINKVAPNQFLGL